MSKLFRILAIFLCSVLTLWDIPQTSNKVSAAEPALCSSNEIPTTIEYLLENSSTRYPMSGGVIPKEANALYFKLSGKLTTGKTYEAYVNREVQLAQHNEGYSNQVTFNNAGDTIELSIDKNTLPKLFEPLGGTAYYYSVNLLEGTVGGKFNKDAPKCYITSYRVGQPINFKPCSITLDKSTAGPGQDITASVSNVQLGAGDYKIMYSQPNGVDSVDRTKSPKTVPIDAQGKGSFTFYTGQSFLNNVPVTVIVNLQGVQGTDYSCSTKFNIGNQPVSNTPSCVITPIQEQYSVLDKPEVIATNLQAGVTYWARIIYKNLGEAKDLPDRVVAVDPQRKATFKLSPTGTLPEGTYAVEVYNASGLPDNRQCRSKDFTVGPPNMTPPTVKKCGEKDANGKEIICASGGGDPCDTKDNRGPAFKTAIGCIHTNPVELTKDLMKFIIGISGGLAFLMMLMGAFQILTSADNPDTLKAGRERLTSAVIGLLIVIFAILLLQIIGVGILDIPGFGR